MEARRLKELKQVKIQEACEDIINHNTGNEEDENTKLIKDILTQLNTQKIKNGHDTQNYENASENKLNVRKNKDEMMKAAHDFIGMIRVQEEEDEEAEITGINNNEAMDRDKNGIRAIELSL